MGLFGFNLEDWLEYSYRWRGANGADVIQREAPYLYGLLSGRWGRGGARLFLVQIGCANKWRRSSGGSICHPTRLGRYGLFYTSYEPMANESTGHPGSLMSEGRKKKDDRKRYKGGRRFQSCQEKDRNFKRVSLSVD